MMLAYLNDRFLPAEELTVSALDAGFVSGVTVTDFCRAVRGKLFRGRSHVERFLQDCAVLEIPIRPSADELLALGQHLIDVNQPLCEYDLAVVTFATPGLMSSMTGRAENGPPTLGLHTVSLPPTRYQHLTENGAVLEVVGELPRFFPNDIKHRSRIHWWQAQRRAEIPGSVVGLVDSLTGGLDTPIAAVLMVEGNTLYRMPRGQVLESVSLIVAEEWARSHGYSFQEGSIPELTPQTELLLVGSGFGVAGVKTLIRPNHPSQHFSWPGPTLRQLQADWWDLG